MGCEVCAKLLRFASLATTITVGLFLFWTCTNDLTPLRVAGKSFVFTGSTLGDDLIRMSSDGGVQACRLATVDVDSMLTNDTLQNLRLLNTNDNGHPVTLLLQKTLGRLPNIGDYLLGTETVRACAVDKSRKLLHDWRNESESDALLVRALERAYRHSGAVFDILAMQKSNDSDDSDVSGNSNCVTPLQHLEDLTGPGIEEGKRWMDNVMQHIRSGVAVSHTGNGTAPALSPGPWTEALQITAASRLLVPLAPVQLPGATPDVTFTYTTDASRQLVLDLVVASLFMRSDVWPSAARQQYKRCYEVEGKGDGAAGVCLAPPYSKLGDIGAVNTSGTSDSFDSFDSFSGIQYENIAYRTKKGGMQSCGTQVSPPAENASTLVGKQASSEKQKEQVRLYRERTSNSSGAAAELFKICTSVHGWSLLSSDWGVPNPMEAHRMLHAANEGAKKLGLHNFFGPLQHSRLFGLSINPPETYKTWYRDILDYDDKDALSSPRCKHAVSSFVYVWYVWLASLPTFVMTALLSGMLLGRASIDVIGIVVFVLAKLIVSCRSTMCGVNVDNKGWLANQEDAKGNTTSNFFISLVAFIYILLLSVTYEPLLRPLLAHDWPRPLCSAESSGGIWSSSSYIQADLDKIYRTWVPIVLGTTIFKNFLIPKLLKGSKDKSTETTVPLPPAQSPQAKWKRAQKLRKKFVNTALQAKEWVKRNYITVQAAFATLLVAGVYTVLLSAVGVSMNKNAVSWLTVMVHDDLPGMLCQSYDRHAGLQDHTRKIVNHAASLGGAAWLCGFHLAAVCATQWAKPYQKNNLLLQFFPWIDSVSADTTIPQLVVILRVGISVIVLPMLIYFSIENVYDTNTNDEFRDSLAHKFSKESMWFLLAAAIVTSIKILKDAIDASATYQTILAMLKRPFRPHSTESVKIAGEARYTSLPNLDLNMFKPTR